MNKYYNYHKNLETVPYTYKIKHKITGQIYYGSRYCYGAHPSKFFKDYFTSSKLIHAIIEKEGVELFDIKITKIFKNKEDCIKWELEVLRRLNITNNSKFLNIDYHQNSHKAIQNNTRTISINNGIKVIRWPITKPIPEGFKKGNLRKGNNKKGRKWYHNPITNEDGMFFNQPKDWLPGRSPDYKGNSKTLKNKKMIWITNGAYSYQHESNKPIPDGYKKGRYYINKPSGQRKHKYIWITDGKNNIQIPEFKEIPKGFKQGISRIQNGKYNPSAKAVIINDVSYDTIKEASKHLGVSTYYIKLMSRVK